MKRRTIVMTSLLLVFVVGCMGRARDHLIYHQKTVLGVDISPSPESSDVHVVVGYDRKTVAYVPKIPLDHSAAPADPNQPSNANCPGEQGSAASGNAGEAMSVVSMSKIIVRLVGLPSIEENFATGCAAIQVAGNAAAIEQLKPEDEGEVE